MCERGSHMPPNAQHPIDAQLVAAKVTIEQMFQHGDITVRQVFVEQVLEALACIEAQDYPAFVTIKESLKQAKISLRDLAKALKPYQPSLRLVRDDEPPPLNAASRFLPDAPLPGLIIPPPYILQEGATSRLVEHPMTGVLEPQAIAYAPLLITGRLQHIDDQGQWLRLEWKRGNQWHTQDIDRGVAMNATKLLDLASQGLPVATDNAAHIAHYFHLLEATNYDTIPVAQMATRLGWQGEKGAYGFLCGQTLARADEMLTIDDLSSVATSNSSVANLLFGEFWRP